MKTTVIVEELMKECGYNGSPRPGCTTAWKLRHFIHEDNKIWVYIMDDTSIRLWREPNTWEELGMLIAEIGGDAPPLGVACTTYHPRAKAEVIDLTDPNSFVKVKKFLNKAQNFQRRQKRTDS